MINDSLPFIVISILLGMYITVMLFVYAIYRFGKQENGAIRLGQSNLVGISVVTLALLGMAVMGYVTWPTQTDRSEASASPSLTYDWETLLKMGKNLFEVNCVICHGQDGKAPGGKGADLTHRISLESALLNIQRGANNFKRAYPGGMPPMMADRMRAANIAHYVSSGFTENDLGKQLYQMVYCARCHGEDGRGIAFMGPNIREFDEKTIILVLKNGKNGVIGKMPRFEQFSDLQLKALATYVMQFSRPEKAK